MRTQVEREQKKKKRKPAPGAAKLLAFIQRIGISYEKAAEVFGLKHPAVWQWANEKSVPRERFRKAIENWTDGEITESDWDRDEERKWKDPADVKPYRPGAER